MINHPSRVKRSWGGFLSSLAGIKFMCWIDCITRAGVELHAMVYLIPQADANFMRWTTLFPRRD